MTPSILRPLATLLFGLSLTLLVSSVSIAQVDGAYNTTAFDSLDPGTSDQGRYSAVWGYTAPDGREYALLGGYTGTHIIDITEKPIREVAFIDGPDNGWREMKTFGEYAYVVTEGGDVGLQIIDLKGLPESASLLNEDDRFFATGHTITQEGDWIYVHGTDVDAGHNAGTVILEVATDPENPTYAGAYRGDYVHDAMIRNDTLYGSMINNGRLDIVALSKDRDSATRVTTITYPGAGTHNSDNTLDGRYIMTTDEVGSTAKTMKVWDRGDIDDIVMVAEYTPVPDAIIHQVHTVGDLVVAAWYTAGVRIIDMSDPTNPAEVGFYDHYPGSASRYNGCWEVYPYFASGKMIASDTRTGLHVFTYDGAVRASATLTVRDSSTGSVLPGVDVELIDLGRSETTDANGQIEIEAASGESGYRVRLLNYREKSGSFQLRPGGGETTIEMVQLPLRTVNIIGLQRRDGLQITEDLAYSVEGRPESGRGANGSVTLQLPADSAYKVRIGSWGYYPRTVSIAASDAIGPVEVMLETGYFDDASLDLGWTFGDESDDGVAGQWERVQTVGVAINFNNSVVRTEPGVDGGAEVGGFAFMTDGASRPGEQPGSTDIDSGAVTLTSPIFDLTEFEDLRLTPTISFSLWYSNDAAPFFTADDNLYIRLSYDGGDTWEDVLSVGSGSDGWEVRGFMANKEPTDRMLFRIVAADSGAQGWTEAALDDFEVGYSSNVSGTTVDDGLDAQLFSRDLHGTARLQLASENGPATITVDLYDGLGRRIRTVFEGQVGAGTTVLPIERSDLAQGAYHLVLRTETGALVRMPLIVQR